MNFPGRTSAGIRTRYARIQGATVPTTPKAIPPPLSYPAAHVTTPMPGPPGIFFGGLARSDTHSTYATMFLGDQSRPDTHSTCVPLFLPGHSRLDTLWHRAGYFLFSQSKIGNHRSDAGRGGPLLPRHPKKTRPSFSHPAVDQTTPTRSPPGTFLRGPGEARHPNAIRPLIFLGPHKPRHPHWLRPYFLTRPSHARHPCDLRRVVSCQP